MDQHDEVGYLILLHPFPGHRRQTYAEFKEYGVVQGVPCWEGVLSCPSQSEQGAHLPEGRGMLGKIKRNMYHLYVSLCCCCNLQQSASDFDKVENQFFSREERNLNLI